MFAVLLIYVLVFKVVLAAQRLFWAYAPSNRLIRRLAGGRPGRAAIAAVLVLLCFWNSAKFASVAVVAISRSDVQQSGVRLPGERVAVEAVTATA